jgi:hypothetical protein
MTYGGTSKQADMNRRYISLLVGVIVVEAVIVLLYHYAPSELKPLARICAFIPIALVMYTLIKDNARKQK